MIPIHETAGGVTFAVKVQPRARRNAIIGELGEALKLALTAPPVDGKANEACIDFFSDALHVPRSAVTILSGHTSRNKVMCVKGITGDRLRKLLEP